MSMICRSRRLSAACLLAMERTVATHSIAVNQKVRKNTHFAKRSEDVAGKVSFAFSPPRMRRGGRDIRRISRQHPLMERTGWCRRGETFSLPTPSARSITLLAVLDSCGPEERLTGPLLRATEPIPMDGRLLRARVC